MWIYEIQTEMHRELPWKMERNPVELAGGVVKQGGGWSVAKGVWGSNLSSLVYIFRMAGNPNPVAAIRQQVRTVNPRALADLHLPIRSDVPYSPLQPTKINPDDRTLHDNRHERLSNRQTANDPLRALPIWTWNEQKGCQLPAFCMLRKMANVEAGFPSMMVSDWERNVGFLSWKG